MVSSDSRRPPISARTRAGCVLISVVLLAPLVVASQLRPSPQGLGTHRQLGLPPCAMTRLFNLRCPSCGMTTSWAHATRGDLASAARASVCGTVLAGLALAGAVWFGGSAARGRWLPLPNEWWLIKACTALAAGIVLEWAWRILQVPL